MKLIKKLEIEGSLQELLKQVAQGEHIIVCESDNPNYWTAHARGVVFPHQGKLLLNGEEVLYDGEFDDWETCGEEFVILRDSDQSGDDVTFLRNGREVLYKGAYDSCRIHPDGIVVQLGEKLLLNGTQLLHEGDITGWDVHKEGVVVCTTCGLLLNGETKLYEGDLGSWKSTVETGLVIKVSNKLLLQDGRSIQIPTDVSGGWQLHPKGVIVLIGRQFQLYPFSTAV